MTTENKTWLKDNFLSLIIIAMITAYFVVDLYDKQKNDAEHITFSRDISDLKAITYNLVETYNGKKNKDDQQDREILDLWKTTKRGSPQELKNEETDLKITKK